MLIRRKVLFFVIIVSNILNDVMSNGYQYYNISNEDSDSHRCKTSDGLEGECKPYTYCFHQYDNMFLMQINTCIRESSVVGICCPIYGTIREPLIKKIPFKRPKQMKIIKNKSTIDKNLLNNAIFEAKHVCEQQLSAEKDLIIAGHHQRNNTMESFHQGFFGSYNMQRRQLARDGRYILETSRIVSKKLRLSPQKCRDILYKYCLNNTPLWDKCPKDPKCNPNYKYRSIDGTCNNIKHPLWGKAYYQLSRLIPPVYSDGIDAFRKSVEGLELPGPRELSSYLTVNGESDDPNLSILFLQYGQFIDHDITLGLNTRADTGEGLSCCDRTRNGQYIQHPDCKPIIIPPNDHFYSQYNQTCNNFVRSIASPISTCSLGPREQAGSVTHFLDGSHIYGSDAEREKTVRSFRDGKLRVSVINGKEFLPYDTKELSVVCSAPENSAKKCIYAGDIRVNQQLGLLVLHLMFFREHNRIAGKLKLLNPDWTDETLFQETRRIIGAQLQWITYNEFLPLALGRRAMKVFDLCPSQWTYSFHYNPNYNPSVLNEFTASAFRWHTLVQSSYNLLNSDGEYTQHLRLRSIFNDPSALYRSGAVDEVLYGAVVQPSQTFDPIFTDEVKHQLFPSPKSPFGGDLVAINIQRGRDHGLPPYNEFREICGLPKLQNFEDLNKYFRYGIAKRFEKIYRNVNDIDLFMGGIYEKPLKEGILGPTFACIVSEQFRRTKHGDRFWFENFGFSHSFSEAQMNEIRKVSLSGIICANGDDIKFYPPLALLQPINGNRLIECSKIPQMDFSHWKNEKLFHF